MVAQASSLCGTGRRPVPPSRMGWAPPTIKEHRRDACATKGLTAGFAMGSGVAPPPWPPETLGQMGFAAYLP
jgi:hypothetical protein